MNKKISLIVCLIFIGTIGSDLSAASITSPTQISGLKLFLDTSSGLYQDTARTIPAVADGDLVGGWTDQSGQGNNASSTGSLRPTLKINQLNGKSTLRFNGSSTYFSLGTTTSLLSLQNNSYSFYFVTRPIGTQGSFPVVFSNTAVGGEHRMFFVLSQDTLRRYSAFAVSTAPTAYVVNQTFSTLYSFASSTTLNSGTETYTQNGVLVGSRTGSVPAVENNEFDIGYRAGGNFFNGDIIAVLGFDHVLTTAEQSALDVYYREQYSNNYELVFDGNSLTYGSLSSTDNSYPAQTARALGVPYIAAPNHSVQGQTTAQMIADAATQIDPLASTTLKKILYAWEIRNDIVNGGVSAAQARTNMISYAQGRKDAGFKVVLYTALPSTSFSAGAPYETARQTVNAGLLADFTQTTGQARIYKPNASTTYADLLIDIGSDPFLGPATSTTNTTYYVDQTHLTDVGYGIVANYAAAAAPLVYSSISLSTSTILNNSTNVPVTITGTSTSWSSGTPGSPTFTVLGVGGVSIASQTVTDATHAIVYLNTGTTTAVGTITITDPSTGSTATTTIIADTTSPTISSITALPSQTSALISFVTNELATSTVSYGLTASYGMSSSSSAFSTSTSFNLLNLIAGTTYHYKISVWDMTSNNATSGDLMFITSAAPTLTTNTSSPGSSSSGPDSIPLSLRTPAVPTVTTIPTITTPYTFTKSLSSGASNPEVKNLQKYLNSKGFTISKAGAGSPGKETTLFGPATKAALIRFQKANKIYPAIGFFGPITRAFIANMK